MDFLTKLYTFAGKEPYEKRTIILINIIDILKKNESSIADILRQTEMKRSTLMHYLNILKSKEVIESERVEEELRGRPTIVKLTKKAVERLKKDEMIWKRMEEADRILNLKVKLEVLKMINVKKMNIEQIESKIENKFGESGLDQLSFLHDDHEGLLEDEIKITPEGKKFLKENSKK